MTSSPAESVPHTAPLEHIVVGGGPLGASAAKYLAQAGKRTLLFAPREPSISGDLGLFSSHGDFSRITRGLDSHRSWARLATRSIQRYRTLEDASGIPFFTETGCLTVVEGSAPDLLARAEAIDAIAATEGIPHQRLDSAGMGERLPYLRLAPGSLGFLEERNAGWVNPREFVRAQIEIGVQHGLEVCYEPVETAEAGPRTIDVETRSGQRFTSAQALFAMGPYSAFDLPVPLDEALTLFARTVVHVPLSDDQVATLSGMPSMIIRGQDDDHNCYILPPMLYPDGVHYIKIGGGRRAQAVTTREQLQSWFEGPGDAELADSLRRRLGELLPSTRPEHGRSQACAITVTANGLPRAVRLRDNVGLLTGGNGHAAKSGDEIGRLGAALMLGREDRTQDHALDVYSG